MTARRTDDEVARIAADLVADGLAFAALFPSRGPRLDNANERTEAMVEIDARLVALGDC